MSVIAVIPARGGSKGLKNKNILNLNGKPLISYTIEAALKSNCFKSVIVSTDSIEIKEVAEKYGAKVPFLRPDELAKDSSTSFDALYHAVIEIENNGHEPISDIALLQPTSPLRNEKHIKEAFDIYNLKGKTPLVSVKKVDNHPYIMKELRDDFLVDFIKDKPLITRRQDFPTLYELNGAIYLTSSYYIKKLKKIYADKVIPYIMAKDDSIDIDDRTDFLLAELILKNEVM